MKKLILTLTIIAVLSVVEVQAQTLSTPKAKTNVYIGERLGLVMGNYGTVINFGAEMFIEAKNHNIYGAELTLQSFSDTTLDIYIGTTLGVNISKSSHLLLIPSIRIGTSVMNGFTIGFGLTTGVKLKILYFYTEPYLFSNSNSMIGFGLVTGMGLNF